MVQGRPRGTDHPIVARVAAVLLSTLAPASVLAVSLEVEGAAPARPGERAALTVVLHAEGADVTGIQVDIGFAPDTPVAHTERGRPDCQDLCRTDFARPSGAAVASGDGDVGGAAKSCYGSSFAFLPLGCEPGVDCTGVRALHLVLDSVDPLPDGAYVLQCAVEVSAEAELVSHPLSCANPGASDPNGNPLPASCTAGAIDVACPGDCDRDARVTVNELVSAMRITQGEQPLAMCAAADLNGDAVVAIHELVVGRNILLEGCRPAAEPTP